MAFAAGIHNKDMPANRAKESLLASPNSDKRRSTPHVILLHIGIRIKYLIESIFFLNPIFNSHLSAYPAFTRPKGIPQVDWPTLFAIRMIWFVTSIFRAHRFLLFIMIKIRVMHLLNYIFLALQRRIARIMEESGIDWEKARKVPIPDYDWKNGNPEEFYQTFIKKPHPVVLRGFMKDKPLLKEYNFDKLVEKYGDETVLVTTVEKDGQIGKLKDVVNPKVYLHNSEVLFRKYPQILEALETERLHDYMHMKSGYQQIFVGRQGTGTPFHMASNVNMFYMVDGTKTWYFHDPYDMYLTNPIMVWGAAAGTFITLYPDDYDESVMPAYKYCPYYTTDLEPGDVLYNPAWWAHAIRNTSDKSVGMATRWLAEGKVGSNLYCPEEDYDINRFASFVFMSGPKSYGFIQEILYEPSPSYDEHSTLREKNVRFSDRQRQLAKGKIVIDGWRPIF